MSDEETLNGTVSFSVCKICRKQIKVNRLCSTGCQFDGMEEIHRPPETLEVHIFSRTAIAPYVQFLGRSPEQ